MDCTFLFDGSKGNTPIIKIDKYTRYLKVYGEYFFDWSKRDFIKTSPIKIIGYNDLFDVTYIGRFRIHSTMYRRKTNYAFIGLTLLLAIFCDKEAFNKYGYLTLLNKIIESDYETTLKIFGMLGGIIPFIKLDYKKENAEKIINFYEAESIWLNYWNSNKDTYDLKQSNINWVEKFALLSKRKYELIKELYSNRYLDESLPSANIIWLLSEFSYLLKALNCSAENINQLYKNVKQHIDMLNDFGEKPPTYKAEGYFENLDEYINTQARNLAEENSFFDKNYYKTWISAWRSANAYGKNNKLELVGSSPLASKPGRKLGQKRNGKNK